MCVGTRNVCMHSWTYVCSHFKGNFSIILKTIIHLFCQKPTTKFSILFSRPIHQAALSLCKIHLCSPTLVNKNKALCSHDDILITFLLLCIYCT